MTKPLDPAAKLGLKVLLVIGALFVLTEVVRLVLTVVYLIRGDLDGLSAVLLMLLYLSFALLAVRLMSKGLRRLRQDNTPARQ